MIQITLKQLNDSYPALMRLASRDLPKDQHKVVYKMSRVMKSAKREIEEMSDALNSLMAKCGFQNGDREVDAEKIREFNNLSKAFLAENNAEIWGDPFCYDEIAALTTKVEGIEICLVNALDLAELDWLIIDEVAIAEEKAATDKRSAMGA